MVSAFDFSLFEPYLENINDYISVTSNLSDQLNTLIFLCALIAGVLLAQAFNFWKW